MGWNVENKIKQFIAGLDKIYYIVLVLWPPDTESQLNVKDPDASKDEGKKEETAEDETVGY